MPVVINSHTFSHQTRLNTHEADILLFVSGDVSGCISGIVFRRFVSNTIIASLSIVSFLTTIITVNNIIRVTVTLRISRISAAILDATVSVAAILVPAVLGWVLPAIS